MAYRSDVTIACGERAYEMFVEALKSVNAAPDKTYYSESDETYILSWENEEWASYLDTDTAEMVEAVENVISELDSMDEDKFAELYGEDDVYDEYEFGYKFIRIGEDETDIEIDTNNPDIELYVGSHVEMPDDAEEVSFE